MYKVIRTQYVYMVSYLWRSLYERLSDIRKCEMTERKVENVVVSKSKSVPVAAKVVDTGKSTLQWTALKGTLNNAIIDLNCEIAHDSKYTYIRYDNARALYESDNHNPIVSTTKGQYYDKITGITLTVTAYEYRYSKSGKKSKTYSG